MASWFKKPKYQQPPDKELKEDLEEDGFVLVGQTEDERNTLTPDKPEYHQQDLPPMYQYSEGRQDFNQKSQRNDPVYENFRTSSTYENFVPGSFQPSQTQLLKDNSKQSTSQSSENAKPSLKTSVHDIPFQLADSVVCAFNHGRQTIDIGDDFSFSSSQYDYDFSTERAILQQMDNF